MSLTQNGKWFLIGWVLECHLLYCRKLYENCSSKRIKNLCLRLWIIWWNFHSKTTNQVLLQLCICLIYLKVPTYFMCLLLILQTIIKTRKRIFLPRFGTGYEKPLLFDCLKLVTIFFLWLVCLDFSFIHSNE